MSWTGPNRKRGGTKTAKKTTGHSGDLKRSLSISLGFTLAICLIIASLFSAASSGQWSDFRGGEKNWGFSDRTLPEFLNISWETNLTGGWIDPSPAICDGKVYILTNGEYDFTDRRQVDPSTLVCLEERSGDTLWSVKVSDSKVQLSSPTVDGDVVAVGSSDGNLYAFNAASGTARFKFSSGSSTFGITSSPLLVSGKLVFGGGDGVIYCLNRTGKLIWSHDTGDTIYFSSPCYDNGKIYIGNDGGNLSCLDASSGMLEWRHTVDGRIRTSPLITEELIIFTWGKYSGNIVTDGWLRTIDHNGTFQNEAHLGGTISSPATDGKYIFVGNNEGTLACFDTEGSGRWEFRANGPVQSSPAVSGNGVLFLSNINMSGNHSTLYFLDKEGGLFYEYEISPHQWALSSPAIGNGCVIFASDNGRVYCISTEPFAPGENEKGHHENNNTNEEEKRETPGQWLEMGIMVIFIVSVITMAGKKGDEGQSRHPDHLDENIHDHTVTGHVKGKHEKLLEKMEKRMNSSRRRLIFKTWVIFTVLIVFTSAIVASFYISGVGSRGTPGPVSDITLIIDFGNEKTPLNNGNLTTWSFSEDKWQMRRSPSERTLWRFENISSHEGTVLDCLKAAMEIVRENVLTSEYIYGTFVVSIAGVENGRDDNNWLYWVNGDFANMASDEYYLEDGDVVLWKYSGEF